jgi:hypothetical protein
VGIGLDFDDTTGTSLILYQIAPNGPAAGLLKIGDELVRVKDDTRSWESFHDLRSGLWGQGLEGTEVAMTVRRNGQLLTFHLKRERIESFDLKFSDMMKNFIPEMQKNWPDLKSEIKIIFGADDMVSCYMVNSGTNLEFGRSAIWGEMDLFRLENGRITETWMVENSFSELKQLGYQITEPIREPA